MKRFKDFYYYFSMFAKMSSKASESSLPLNFHKTLIESENKFFSCPSYELVEEIMLQYKIGIEYYSTRDTIKQTDYLNRMKTFFGMTSVIRLFHRQRERDDTCPQHFQRKRNKKSYTLPNNLRFFKSNNLIDKPIKKRINYFLINQLSTKIKSKTPKEVLRVFSLGLAKAQKLFKATIASQRQEFLYSVRRKKIDKMLNANSEIRITRSSLQKKQNPRIKDQTSFRKNSIPSPTKKIKLLNEDDVEEIQASDNLAKWNKKNDKEKQIGEIIRAYFKKFHFNFQSYCGLALGKMNKILDDEYRKKIEKYCEISDSMSEFELMLVNYSNSAMIRSVASIIHTMKLENQSDMIQIAKERSSLMSKMTEEMKWKNLNDDLVICNLSTEMMTKLLEIFI